MRRPDVFTLDYSHPLAQGLVFAWLQGADQGLLRRPTGVIGAPASTIVQNNTRGHVFNGTSDAFLFTPPMSSMSLEPVTISTWTIPSESGSTRYIVNMCDPSNTLRYMGLVNFRESGLSVFRFVTRFGTAGERAARSDSVQPGKLTHLLGELIPNTSVKLYVDGMIGDTTAVPQSASLPVTDLTIGRGVSAFWYHGSVYDTLIHNRALSPAEIAILADRTDPMLGGLIVEERPVLYFDMGGSTEVEGPAVITAASTIAASGSKQAVSPATVTASASVGMGGIKGAVAPLNIVGSISVEASGIKSTSGPATFTAAAEYGASGIKTIIGLDKEGPAVITASATVGMGGVKGGVGAAVLGAGSAMETGGVKGAAGQAWFAAMGEFYAVRGPDEVPITADEIGRAASLQARNYSAVLAKRNYTARL